VIEKWQGTTAFPRADYNRYRSVLQSLSVTQCFTICSLY